MATYQRSMDELDQLGVYVIGATIEDRDTAARMAEEEGITFPMAYGVTQESIKTSRPFVEEKKRDTATPLSPWNSWCGVGL